MFPGVYKVPPDGVASHYVSHVEGLPRDDPPRIFGIHTSGSISKQQNELSRLFSAVLLTQVPCAQVSSNLFSSNAFSSNLFSSNPTRLG